MTPINKKEDEIFVDLESNQNQNQRYIPRQRATCLRMLDGIIWVAFICGLTIIFYDMYIGKLGSFFV